jgi:hypothetical protein
LRYARLAVVFLFLPALIPSHAQTARNASHLAPTGKGWGEAVAGQAKGLVNLPKRTVTNGILYHGGPIMPGAVNLYFIWYGNFVNGPATSDARETEDLISPLFGDGGLGGSAYAHINSTYTDQSQAVTGNFALAGTAYDYYSHGHALSDASVAAVVANAISSHVLPKDANGIYFVLSSSDVSESSGFCTQYCGWHSHATISGGDLKFAFVGNPDRCPRACEEQVVSSNGDSGADAMASTMVHEIIEATNDPDLNAWYDTNGNESADKCAWKWGPVTGALGQGAYKMTVAGQNWLIQMNWENSRGGGCDQYKGGKFFSR